MPYVVNDGLKIPYSVEGTGAPLILQHGSPTAANLSMNSGTSMLCERSIRLSFPIHAATAEATNLMSRQTILRRNRRRHLRDPE
jgi:hypothetical protein